MTDPLTADESTCIRRAVCPKCRRQIVLHPQRNGFDNPITDKPYRYTTHSGNRWGRQCPNSGELQT